MQKLCGRLGIVPLAIAPDPHTGGAFTLADPYRTAIPLPFHADGRARRRVRAPRGDEIRAGGAQVDVSEFDGREMETRRVPRRARPAHVGIHG